MIRLETIFVCIGKLMKRLLWLSAGIADWKNLLEKYRLIISQVITKRFFPVGTSKKMRLQELLFMTKIF